MRHTFRVFLCAFLVFPLFGFTSGNPATLPKRMMWKVIKGWAKEEGKDWIKKRENYSKVILIGGGVLLGLTSLSVALYNRGRLLHFFYKKINNMPDLPNTKCHRCRSVSADLKCPIGHYTCSACCNSTIAGKHFRCSTCLYKIKAE